MLLIIPSIHIKNGKCFPKVDYFDSHHLPNYDEPWQRARLLRIENAKALHLFFESNEPYSTENIEVIQQVRKAIDLPLGITVNTHATIEQVRTLFDNGVYRVVLKDTTNFETIKAFIKEFTAQRLAFYFNLNNDLSVLPQLKSLSVCRLVLEAPSSAIAQIKAIADQSTAVGLRLSLITRVPDYKRLIELQELSPAIDSIILDDSLEHDAFPCEALWRRSEERAFSEKGIESNCWKNPLETTHK